MAETGDSLVMRRPKRSTAGNRYVVGVVGMLVLVLTRNRMEAALAEFRADDLGQDAEEDNDFVMEVGMYCILASSRGFN